MSHISSLLWRTYNPSLGAVQVLDSATVNNIAQTIQSVEGYTPGSIAYRNNNPGNLMYAGQSGATGQDSSGFAIFTSYNAGYQALLNQIQLDASRGMTIQQMMSKYAPAGHGNNDPTAYANIIAANLNVPPDVRLIDIGSVPPVIYDENSFQSAGILSTDWSTIGLVAGAALVAALVFREI